MESHQIALVNVDLNGLRTGLQLSQESAHLKVCYCHFICLVNARPQFEQQVFVFVFLVS